ncbi:MAG: META domain-containing protein, partial [Ardenticatenaceae bacterium]
MLYRKQTMVALFALLVAVALAACAGLGTSPESPDEEPTPPESIPTDIVTEPADVTPEPEPGATATPGESGDAEPAAPELTGPIWQLVSLNGQPPIGDKPLIVVFERGGVVGGDAGCNQFGGAFSVDGNSITIENLVQTQMACLDPAGIMEQESAYLSALTNAATYQVTDGSLEILSA